MVRVRDTSGDTASPANALRTKTNPYVTSSTRQLSAAVVQRDGACVECGSTSALQAHHVIPRAEGGPDALENLEALCVRCHSRQSAKENAPPVAARACGGQLQRRACLRDHRCLPQPSHPIIVSADRTLRGGKRQEQDFATERDVYEALTGAGYAAVETGPHASIRDWLELVLSFLGGASATVALRLGQQVADDTLDRISEVVVGRVERRLQRRELKGKKATVVVYGPNGEEIRRLEVTRQPKST